MGKHPDRRRQRLVHNSSSPSKGKLQRNHRFESVVYVKVVIRVMVTGNPGRKSGFQVVGDNASGIAVRGGSLSRPAGSGNWPRTDAGSGS